MKLLKLQKHNVEVDYVKHRISQLQEQINAWTPQVVDLNFLSEIYEMQARAILKQHQL